MTNLSLDTKETRALQCLRTGLNQSGRMLSVRELMTAMEYRSPRSAAVMLEKLAEKGVLNKKPDGKFQFNKGVLSHTEVAETTDIPLVGTTSCGGPMFAEENIEAYYKISTKLAPPYAQHFFLRICGDSMNKRDIHDGDLVLIRQQTTAKTGDIVVALIDDEATIKEYHVQDGLVVLKPCSTNQIHKPIIVTEDFRIQGVVIKSLSNL